MIRGSRKLVVPKNKYSIREGSMERVERTVEDNTPTEVDISEVVDTENLEERRGERRDKRRGRRNDSKEKRARKALVKQMKNEKKKMHLNKINNQNKTKIILPIHKAIVVITNQ